MDERILPPWANELTEDEFISYSISYPVGKYIELYEKQVFPNAEVGDLTYYYYDPTQHGYPKDQQYPLLTFFHGSTNSFEGDICVNYCGAENYASPKYQETMGGAYILIPLANEKHTPEDEVIDGWDERYIDPIMSLVKNFEGERTENIGKKFAFGNSSGATFCQKITEAEPAYWDACIPVGSSYVPSDESLDVWDTNGVYYFLATSLHDEFHNVEEDLAPRMKRLQAMKHIFLFTPKWTYNGDGGIASINVGVEMGQHCLMNSMQANLMFDNGTPMDERLPKGVTGWVRQVCDE